MKKAVLLLVGLLVWPAAPAPHAQQSRSSAAGTLPPGVAVLTPTSHPLISNDLSALWLAPERGTAAARPASRSPLAAASQHLASGEHHKALAAASQPASRQGALADYAAYYAAMAQLGLGHEEAARAEFRQLQERKLVGFLSEAAALGEAEALEDLGKYNEAVAIYERLLKGRLSDVEAVYMRLGAAARKAGDVARAADAYSHVLYEFPLGANAPAAASELDLMRVQKPIEAGSARYRMELGRAERLFGARRYDEARALFDDLEKVAKGDDEELVALRLAECDYFLKKSRNAREALRPLTQEGVSRRGEALFFYAQASRAAGDTETFLTTLRRIATEFPEQTWAEDALDNLGTYYIRANEDDQADAIFRELYQRYPRGTYSERAAWKAGWTAYRKGDFAYASRVFEQAASDFPRSDYRPSWLYWAGRAQDQLGATANAQDRYLLAAADYMNSWYGRLAIQRLDTAAADRLRARTFVDATNAAGAERLPANRDIVRALLDAGMLTDAMNELRYAQRVWGDSSAIQATIAWVRQQQARDERGMQRLLTLRNAINTMRRAYPQFMAAGGEDLPREVLTVIYPLAYWDLIRKHAEANGLDPYLVAALIAQESTFVPDVKSGANAYGLMQLLPSTARQYARKLKMPYSSRLLTNPDANIRMGTAYLADKIREFGDLHLVLASYNAGERAVRRWQQERPQIDTDEFVDDIPYPETQHYVKKILGTAEDYRRLYAGATGASSTIDAVPPAAPSAPAVAAPGPQAPAVAAPKRNAPAPTRKPATPKAKRAAPRKSSAARPSAAPRRQVRASRRPAA